MATIEVDFDVFKALTMKRSSEEITENDVLRGLLGLPALRKSGSRNGPPADDESGKDWIVKRRSSFQRERSSALSTKGKPTWLGRKTVRWL